MAFCDNPECELNRVKEVPPPGVRLTLDIFGRRRDVERHLYGYHVEPLDGEPAKDKRLFLCTVCHSAVQMIRNLRP